MKRLASKRGAQGDSKMILDPRRWFALLLLCGASFAAGAQVVDVTPPTPAHALACLLHDAAPPQYPAKSDLDHASGAMRVLLRFEHPDAKPTVEVLANSAREDMQDQVYRYLASYRLPCMTPADGIVTAVQEFSFRNTDRAPLPISDKHEEPHCIVMPRESLDDVGLPDMEDPGTRKPFVVVTMTFAGDAQQEPEAQVLVSSTTPAVEGAVLRYVRQYRMPCRTAADSPRVARQVFVFVDPAGRQYGFKHEVFGLAEFLGMTDGIRDVDAAFDFNTMGCPFKVNYTMYAPHMPNEVETGEAQPNPNRVLFLNWLAERQLSFGSKKDIANALFATTLQINVPCGRLVLQPDAAAAAR